VKDIYLVAKKMNRNVRKMAMARNDCKMAKCKSCPFHFELESKSNFVLYDYSHFGPIPMRNGEKY
jgi:hypothetical protein